MLWPCCPHSDSLDALPQPMNVVPQVETLKSIGVHPFCSSHGLVILVIFGPLALIFIPWLANFMPVDYPVTQGMIRKNTHRDAVSVLWMLSVTFRKPRNHISVASRLLYTKQFSW